MSKIKGRNKRAVKRKVLRGNKKVKKKASEELEIFALLILQSIFKKNHDFLSQAPIQANKVLSDPPEGN